MSVSDRWHTRAEAEACREHGLAPSAKHGQGKRWEVRYRDQARTQRSRCFSRKADAQSFAAQVRAQLDTGQYIDPGAGRVTFRQYADQFRAAATHDLPTAERIERNFRLHAYPVIGGHALRNLAARPSVMQAWISGLNLSPASAGQVVKDVSAVFVAAVDDQIIARNPLRAASVRRPAVPKVEAVPWTAELVHAMADAMPDRLSALVLLGAACGPRFGELAAIDAADLTWLARVLHVRAQIRATNAGPMFAQVKNRKPHTVPVPDFVLARLAEHVRQFPPVAVSLPWQLPSGKPVTRSLIFSLPDGRPLNRQRFGEIWRKAARKAGVPDGRRNGPHVLRHTAASAWLGEGQSVAAVAAFLGDSQATIVSTYSHFMPGDDDRARKIMERFLCPPSAPDVRSGRAW